MAIKTIFFDLDGTLLDSMNVWMTMLKRYLLSKGIKPALADESPRPPAGLFTAIKRAQQEYGIQDSRELLFKDIGKIVKEFYLTEATIKPDVADTLAELHRLGYRLALATATPGDIADVPLKRFGIFPYFSAIYAWDKIGHGKGEPAYFQKILDFEGISAEESIIVEDALYSIKTAANYGLHTAAVYDFSAQDEWPEIQNTAEIVLGKFSEIIPFCKNIRA